MLRVSGQAALFGAASAALAEESDSQAAAELVRALVVFGDDAVAEAATRTALRLGDPDVTTALVSSLARRHGVSAYGLIERLASVDGVDWELFFWRASGGQAKMLGVSLAKVVARQDATMLSGLLAAARRASGTLAEGPLRVALKSQDEGVRRVVYEHLVAACASTSLSPELRAEIEALVSSELRAEESALPTAEFTLMRRACGAGGDDPVVWHGMEVHELREFAYGAFAPWLRPAEEEALYSAMGEGMPRRVVKAKRPVNDSPPMSTIEALPPGMLEDVLSITGCRPKKRRYAAAVLRYEQGSPRRVLQLIDTSLDAACQKASLVLLASTLSLGADGGVGEEIVVLPLNEAFVDAVTSRGDCTVRSSPQELRRIGGTIKPPKKVVDMDPRYPANALDARVQGIVVLKSVLSASGCVTAVKVLASRSPPLDLEALNTVSHWRYRPAELDGERVSVLMSVMVNFKFGY